MARHYLRRKLQTYRSLYHLNRQFASICHHLWQLKRAGFLKHDKLGIFRSLVLELQSQISHDIADRMHHVEDDDMFQYGKTRIAWENWLNPARPAFQKTKKRGTMPADTNFQKGRMA